uniref:FBD domain-containing protein n=1 Tax=Heterorhabditis bacteriophora TaxID=37862 RepID=A0A1I7X0C6_HETBA
MKCLIIIDSMQHADNNLLPTNTSVDVRNINVEDKYDFSTAKPEDRDELKTFLMKHFLVEETMNVATSITAVEFAPYANKCLEKALKIPFSTIARSKDSDSASNCASSRYNFLSSVQNCLLVKRGYLTFEDCCGNTSRPQKAYSIEKYGSCHSW